ncbi:hypothetical protein EUGRSUZ_J00772 [Eucalyptus grandis]|uniref:Uncharacterized protein n=2 Tax=Eucalyptus grandis TaxID=71139 RepID=A0ACC3J3D5_EUCGR|nr:hypothetical protein EUGRSUZ_J00772 [Eucalyptus grandis]
MEDETKAPEEMERELEEMRECYRSGRTMEASWRKSQLKGLLRLLREREEEIFRALHQDLGKHPAEAYRDEIGSLIKSVNYALDGLKRWMSGNKAKLPRLALLTTAKILPEPLGLVLVISSWNFPIGLSLEPLIGALAAGNAVVLKPSELAPECSSLLANAIPHYLDDKAVKVIQGGPGIGERLLLQKWDKIFFTGSARIGRKVIAAAAEHLTPVTLELGGKCPAVIDTLSSSFDRKVAVQRVLGAKFSSSAGQICIGVDYVLVEKKFSSSLVELMKMMMKKMFGENPRESQSVARIVNKHHFLRLRSLLLDPLVKSSIVYGGSMDEESLFIEPTILMDPPLQAAIMMDEIFGPLLPIVTLNKIEDSIEFINSRPKPLAIYVFTKDEPLRRSMVSKTSSGSIVFNDAIVQCLVDTLPFGGIGESGMGRYHGKFSFDTFSHQKAVMRRSFLVDVWFRFPPWNDHKLQLFRSSYHYDYLGIVLTVLGLKRTNRASKGI